MLLYHALPVASGLAHSFPIYEMGSRLIGGKSKGG
jgi:hypothetical protein